MVGYAFTLHQAARCIHGRSNCFMIIQYLHVPDEGAEMPLYLDDRVILIFIDEDFKDTAQRWRAFPARWCRTEPSADTPACAGLIQSLSKGWAVACA